MLTVWTNGLENFWTLIYVYICGLWLYMCCRIHLWILIYWWFTLYMV